MRPYGLKREDALAMEDDPRIEIRELVPPLEGTDLLELLRHKGSPWVEDIRNRAQAEYPGSEDHFLVACAHGRLAAHVWYTTAAADRRLGLLGHVYTRPEDRRKGLSARLMRTAMADFLGRGGRVMQLFTSTPYTVPFYEKLGYQDVYSNRVYHQTDWYMRYPVDSQAVFGEWFSPGDCRMRDLAPGDLPKFCLLYNLQYATKLKDWAQGIGLGLEAEYAFIHTIRRTAKNEAVCCVLENDQTIVGIAAMVEHGFAHQSHLAAVDCCVHPHFQAHAKELIDGCLARRDELAVEIVYAMCADAQKSRLLKQLGFREKATLANHYKIADQRHDCTLYQV